METTIAEFQVPFTNSVTLFRFRTISLEQDREVKYAIYLQPSSTDQETALSSIFAEKGGSLFSADTVFILPPTSGMEKPTILIKVEVTGGASKLELTAAIEDISMLDPAQPFDSQLGIAFDVSVESSLANLPEQLGGSDTRSEAYHLMEKLLELSTPSAKTPFNWLYYSLDRVSQPLDPQSFFLPAHPRNSKVFPLYVEDASKIKFPQRG